MVTRKGKKNDKQTTAERQFRFLCLLSECGNVSLSAKKAKLNRQYLYDCRDENPEFAEAWDKCLKRAGEALKDEAQRRAVQGVLEPVFYKGRKCGTVRKYSDSLLAMLLKAAFPEEYRDKVNLEHTGKDGGPVIMRWAKQEEVASDG